MEDDELVFDHEAGAAPVNEATLASLDAAMEQMERGVGITMEQSTKNLRRRLDAWRKSRDEVLAA